MSFTNFFKRLLGTKAHPAHLPYIPTPPAHQPNASPNQFPGNPADIDHSFTEAEADVNSIAGFTITFGHQKLITVDSRGQAKDFSQSLGHIVGSNKLVRNIEDIEGVCGYCQAEANKAFEENRISIEQAQAKCLYDIQSASRCEICGVNTCCKHTRPIQLPDGLIQQLCVDCQKQLKGQILKQKVVGFLLSPFMETENPNEE